jgi:hypothetical protein
MIPLKPLKLLSVSAAAMTALLLTSGCSGINSGVGVSPASFLLPGLIMNDPQPAPAHPTTPADTNSVVVAQSR